MSEDGFRLERLLPLACVASAGLLIASELMTAFEFTPPGGEAQASQSFADRHHYAFIVLAVFAVVALVFALSTGSRPAAVAVAAVGVIALLWFLITDLPDAGNVGSLDDPHVPFLTAKAEPQAGFWLQLIGALGLALTGAALATLTSDQLLDLRPGGRGRERKPPAAGRGKTSGATGTELIGQTERLGEEVREGAPKEQPARARQP